MEDIEKRDRQEAVLIPVQRSSKGGIEEEAVPPSSWIPDAAPGSKEPDATTPSTKVSVSTAINACEPAKMWVARGMAVRNTETGDDYTVTELAQAMLGGQRYDAVICRPAGGGRLLVLEAGSFCAGFEHVESITPPATSTAGLPDEWRLVMDEVGRATRKFPTWPTDPLHAVAILGEEFGELTKVVLQSIYEPHKVHEGELQTEAVQTAAMAMRFLASLGRYRFVASQQHEQSSGG